MILKIKRAGYLAAWALLVLCTACMEPSVIYDSSAGQEEGRDETEVLQEERKEEGGNVSETPMPGVYVYVCGEVKVPGVYELSEGSRIADAVEAAGGMTEQAAKTYLNLAERVKDGQKIEVLSVSEAEEQKRADAQQRNGQINLNQASVQELMTLTGIGEAKAKDILLYREQHGSFSSIEELMEIPGIKSGVFQKIKDQITV